MLPPMAEEAPGETSPPIRVPPAGKPLEDMSKMPKRPPLGDPQLEAIAGLGETLELVLAELRKQNAMLEPIADAASRRAAGGLLGGLLGPRP
jgi:hypothetical protein